MPDNNSFKPTVVVKKADGTLERVPLSHVLGSTDTKARSQTDDSVENVGREPSMDKVDSVTTTQRPDISLPDLPAIPEPIQRAVAPEVQEEEKPNVQSWSVEDHRSPLHEELEDHETMDVSKAKTHDMRVIVDEVMQTMTIRIEPDAQMTARQLIESYVRGIKSKHSVHELAVRNAAEGGLGISETDAARLVTLVDDVKHSHEKDIKKQVVTHSSSHTVVDHSPVKKGLELATSVPVDHVFEDMARAQIQKKQQKAQEEKPVSKIPEHVSKKLEAYYEMPIVPQVRTPIQTQMQRSVQDMHAPVAPVQSMGPVEEMQTFSIEDFRRLGTDPVRSVEKIVQKLMGWKQESFLLYLSARSAWFQSPLYKEFQTLLVEAINDESQLEDYMYAHKDKNRLHVKEFNALVELSGQLAV